MLLPIPADARAGDLREEVADGDAFQDAWGAGISFSVLIRVEAILLAGAGRQISWVGIDGIQEIVYVSAGITPAHPLRRRRG